MFFRQGSLGFGGVGVGLLVRVLLAACRVRRGCGGPPLGLCVVLRFAFFCPGPSRFESKWRGARFYSQSAEPVVERNLRGPHCISSAPSRFSVGVVCIVIPPCAVFCLRELVVKKIPGAVFCSG